MLEVHRLSFSADRITPFSEVIPMRTYVALAALLVFAGSLGAQTPQPTPPGDEVIRVSSRLVVVPVSITDNEGRPINGLTAADLRLTEEGRDQTIERVGIADSVPLEIALLFDVSASTDAMFPFQRATAAKFLKDVMRPDDRASVFLVGEKCLLIQPRSDSATAAMSLERVAPQKELTAFYDSVRSAADYLRTNAAPGSRKVVVIISDGEDTSSEGVTRAIWNAERKVADGLNGTKLRELRVKARDEAKSSEQARVIKALQDADTVFYSINPAGSSYQLNQMSVFGQQNMDRFAGETGGSAFLPRFLPIDTGDKDLNDANIRRNNQMLDGIFRQLASELRSQYLIQYYSEAEFPTDRFVKLQVAVPGRAGVRIRARSGYFYRP